jgi:hypothetical protein
MAALLTFLRRIGLYKGPIHRRMKCKVGRLGLD